MNDSSANHGINEKFRDLARAREFSNEDAVNDGKVCFGVNVHAFVGEKGYATTEIDGVVEDPKHAATCLKRRDLRKGDLIEVGGSVRGAVWAW